MLDLSIVSCGRDAVVVVPSGHLDYQTKAAVSEQLLAKVEPHIHALVWDLRLALQVDSSGLSLLLWTVRRVGQGRVALMGCPGRVVRMLELSELISLFVVSNDVAALAAEPGWAWVADCKSLAPQ
jgi:anti-anti-sigma factor